MHTDLYVTTIHLLARIQLGSDLYYRMFIPAVMQHSLKV